MKKGLKVFLTAAIVLSAVACSTTSDEETKNKDTKEKVVETKEDTSVPKEYRNALHKAENYSKMVRTFLESIDYPKERIHDICYAIAIHVDLKADFDGEYNAFTLSVQEADNIDRVGAYRLYETLEAAQFSKQSIDGQIKYVDLMLQTLYEYASYECTTKTAQTLWLDRIQFQKNYFERLKDQLKISTAL